MRAFYFELCCCFLVLILNVSVLLGKQTADYLLTYLLFSSQFVGWRYLWQFVCCLMLSAFVEKWLVAFVGPEVHARCNGICLGLYP